MLFQWNLIIDLGLVSIALLIATLIRARFSFFQKFLIPNSITAGFLLLPFYNLAAPSLGINTEGLGNLVYHLLSVSFIAMTLRTFARRPSPVNVLSMAVSIFSQYTIMTFLGFSISLLLMATILPDLFPGFGLFLTLGFNLGPGQAFAMGSGWEKLGFPGSGTVGLTFGALGFIFACFIGIPLINIGKKKKWFNTDEIKTLDIDEVKPGVFDRNHENKTGLKETTDSEAIDTLSYNFAYVFAGYLLTFLLLKLITFGLSHAGNTGKELAWNLWGLSFIFAALIAMLIKKLIYRFKLDHTIDNGSMMRITGLSVDIMVAASIGAISIVVVKQYWLPILILAFIGITILTFSHLWLSSRLFDNFRFYRMILIFGTSTGTLPTGLALLRVIDPDFKTPASSDYMYAAVIVFAAAIPMILSMNLISHGYSNSNPMFYWIAYGIYSVYMLVILISYKLISKKNAFKKPGTLWLDR